MYMYIMYEETNKRFTQFDILFSLPFVYVGETIYL